MKDRLSKPPHRLEPDAEERIHRVRKWREKILAARGDIGVTPSASHADQMDIRFAASSLYLNYLWEFASQGEPLRTKLPKTKEFWSEFYNQFGAYLKEREDVLISAIGYRRNQFPYSHWTQLEHITRLLLDVSAVTTRVKGGVGTPSIPSMDALNNVGTHTIQVLVECYEETYGEPMPHEQFVRFTQNPSLKNMMVQWQLNTKDAVLRTLQFLHTDPNMDPASKFHSNPFTIDRENAAFGFRAEFLSVIQTRLKEFPGNVQEPLRGCPVIFSKDFPAMWRWLTDLVMYQLYDTPYPDRPTRAQDSSGTRDRFADDLKIDLEPYLHRAKNT